MRNNTPVRHAAMATLSLVCVVLIASAIASWQDALLGAGFVCWIALGFLHVVKLHNELKKEREEP